MGSAHERLCEVTRIINGDLLAGNLIDDVLVACFDYVIGGGMDDGGPEKRSPEPILIALNRFNACFGKYRDRSNAGLYSGPPSGVTSWAEELTVQIWLNRPN